MHFPIHIFHPASFDKDARALTDKGLAEVNQYIRWASTNGNPRLMVLHSISPEAQATARAFIRNITANDFTSLVPDLLRDAEEIAENAQRYTVVVFVEQEAIYPLSDAVSKLIGGEGVPLFNISPGGGKNVVLPVSGEGLVVLRTHVATQWRIQGRF